jgi:hypothetical protein
MLYSGMQKEGLECIHNIRSRYDGEKRNPWDEAECGHHYARAMASWSSFVALSGFQYDGTEASIVAVPRVSNAQFNSFWSTGTAWGTFSYQRVGAKSTRFTLQVLAGTLACQSCEIVGTGDSTSFRSNGRAYSHTVKQRDGRTIFQIKEPLVLAQGRDLVLEIPL